MSALPHGYCPHCLGNVAVRVGGEVREHRELDIRHSDPATALAAVCPGSGEQARRLGDLEERLLDAGAVHEAAAVTARAIKGGAYPNAVSVAGGLAHLRVAGLVDAAPGVVDGRRVSVWWLR